LLASLWYFPPEGLGEHLRAVPRAAAVPQRIRHTSESREVALGYRVTRRRIWLCAGPRGSMEAQQAVGKAALEATFSLWRPLEGHLREVSCLFLWELSAAEVSACGDGVGKDCRSALHAGRQVSRGGGKD